MSDLITKDTIQPCSECGKKQRLSICDECWKPRDPFQHPDVVKPYRLQRFERRQFDLSHLDTPKQNP